MTALLKNLFLKKRNVDKTGNLFQSEGARNKKAFLPTSLDTKDRFALDFRKRKVVVTAA